MANSPERVLVLALSGIGNFLMQSPVFRAIKTSHPDWHVTVWVAPRGTKTLAQHSPYIDEVIEAPIRNSVAGHLKMATRLRTGQYDIGLVLSPGQLLKSAAYLYFAGIPRRVGYQYPLGNSTASSFLLTDSITEPDGVHDIEQNIALLEMLDIQTSSIPKTYDIAIPQEAARRADILMHELGIPANQPLVGLHVGSARGFEFKRWPLERFIAVGKALSEKRQAHILLFGGPDEIELITQAKAGLGEHATIISSDLFTTAAVMARCTFFVSNDSGLMHVAAAAGAPVYGLFGPTDERLTGPRGRASHVIRAPGTSPIYHTERLALAGTATHESLLALTSDYVLRQLPS